MKASKLLQMKENKEGVCCAATYGTTSICNTPRQLLARSYNRLGDDKSDKLDLFILPTVLAIADSAVFVARVDIGVYGEHFTLGDQM